MRITKCINIPTYMLAMVIYNKGRKQQQMYKEL